jgi:hypothetical protein
MKGAENRYMPHTNTSDTGMPHDSLINHIDQLERERNALARQLTSTLEERRILAERLQIANSAAST